MNLLHQLVEQVLNQGNLAAIDELLAPDFQDEDVFPGEEPGTRESFKAFVKELRGAFPDLQFAPLEEVVVGDGIWGRYHLSGTMTGAFLGQAPTGRRAHSVREMHYVHVNANGQIDHHFGAGDDLGLFQQVGIRFPIPE